MKSIRPWGLLLQRGVAHRYCQRFGALICLLAVSSTSFSQDTTLRFGRITNPLPFADVQLSPLEQEFVASHPVLRVAVTRDSYPPFQYVEDNVVSGHSVEFLQSAAAALGFELELKLYNTWSEALAALRSRDVDVTPTVSQIPGRERFLAFTIGITPNPAGLVGRKDDDRFLRNQQLSSMRVAVGANFAAESYLEEQFPLATPVPVISSQDALERLAANTVDYYYGDLSDLLFETEQELTENLEIKQRVYFGSGWTHLGVRSDWPIVARLFDRFARGPHRDSTVPELAGVISERLDMTLTPLSLTPEEVEFVSRLDVLKVGSIAGMPLLNDVDAEGNHVGIASEFTAYLAHQIGRSVEVTNYPTVEAMTIALEEREIDLIPYFAITAERQRYLAFSRPYLTMPWVAFGQTGDTPFWDLGSLEGRRLAIRKLHPLLPLIRENYPGIELMVTDSAGEAVVAVVKGNAEASVEAKFYVNREVQRNAGQLRVLGEVRDEDGQFAFAARAEDDIKIRVIDKALAKMSPELVDRVVRRWIAIDFEPEQKLRKLLNVLMPVLATLALLLFATLYWNRKVVFENRRRVAAERRLVDMTEGLRTGVFQFQHQRGKPVRMMFSNRQTREMARVPEDNDSGDRMAFFDHIDAEDREAVIEKLRLSLSSGEHFRESFRFNFPGSEKGWILADAQCRTDADGTRVWNGYLFDLTAERSMSEELNALLADRNEFVSMASHELRTPVQNVSLALASIDRSELGEPSLEKLEMASAAANDLEELVSDIVQLSGMNHHAPNLVSEPFDPRELIRTICRTFSATAVRQSLDYTVHIDESLPSSLRGDALRIKQILYNVVGNAIKYTDEGSVRVTARAEGNALDDRVVIQISVTDTGIGIPSASLEKVFEPFATIGPSSRRSSGLGLALCNRLAELMNGRIDVTSIMDKGSTFTVHLPLLRSDSLIAPEPAYKRGQKLREGISRAILVVDDNPMVSELVSSLLEVEGWQTYRANSAEEALVTLNDNGCLAVLTDQQMPGTSGIELAQRIRELHPDNCPILLMMTGGMKRSDAILASDVFDAVLFKPVKTHQIVRAIETCFDGMPVASDPLSSDTGVGTAPARRTVIPVP